uniref:PDZ domain-containing protein n=1 Tax=Setaria digitata TaxID=48799 RepID=A0A915PSX1_9BILA
MALELDTVTSSVNGNGSNSNGSLKANNNYSPISNDSGFHSDRLQYKPQRTVSRNRANIKHKPTYVSVFASDPDCSSPLFDEFDRRFATNRPHFLNGTLHLPTGIEETRSVSAIAAPLITPSHTCMSTNVSPDTTIHPEISRQTYRTKQQAFSAASESACQSEEESVNLSSSSMLPTTLTDQKLSDAVPPKVLSFGSVSKSFQTTQKTSEQNTYKFAGLELEGQGNTTNIKEQRVGKSALSMKESLDGPHAKSERNSSTKVQNLNCHLYPQKTVKPEESCLTLVKSVDLPKTKLFQVSSKQTVEISSDSIKKPISKNKPEEIERASSQRLLTEFKEVPNSEPFLSRITRRHSQESYGTSLEEPPPQILFRNLEFGINSEQKLENQPVCEEQCTDGHVNGKSRFVSFVPTTKLNCIISQEPCSLKNIDESRLYPAVAIPKMTDLPLSSTPKGPSILSVKKPLENYFASDSHRSDQFGKHCLNTICSFQKSEFDSLGRDSDLKSSGLVYTGEKFDFSSLETVNDTSRISDYSTKLTENVLDFTSPTSTKTNIPSSASNNSLDKNCSASFSEKSASAVFEKSTVIPKKFIPSVPQNSAPPVLGKSVHSHGVTPTISSNESQNMTSSNLKFEMPMVEIPRRARDDDKSFTRADNGAIPTPKAFRRIGTPSDSGKSTAMKNRSSSGILQVTTLNSCTVKKVPHSGKIINDKLTAWNSCVETSNRFSTIGNESFSRGGNLFAKAKASFEKTTELLPSRNTDRKLSPNVDENKVVRSASIIGQAEKVESRSMVVREQKESFEECSSLMGKEANLEMAVSLTEVEPPSEGTVKEISKKGSTGGLDFSRFDSITDDDVIGRPLEAEEAEQMALQTGKEVKSNNELRKQRQPSETELLECKSLLGKKFIDYDIFKVTLKRLASNPEGSVGVILSSAASGDQYITVQRVISGSIADRSDLIEKGDRVFFVQGHSTKQMTAADARTLIKQRTEHVVFILGRLKAKSGDMPAEPARFVSTATADPDLFNYSTDSEEVLLTKGSLGVGLALDGGRGSVFGDRPIVIKRVFEGGSAARSGRIKVGDQVITIDGIDVRTMSYLEATKTLRSRPEGPLKLAGRNQPIMPFDFLTRKMEPGVQTSSTYGAKVGFPVK